MEEAEDTEGTTKVFDGTYGGAGGGVRPTVSMSMGDSVSTCFRKGLSLGLFKGRASQSEYNWFLLFYGICTIVFFMMMIDTIMDDIQFTEMDGRYYTEAYETPSPIFCLFLLPFEISLLGVLVRRLHDLGITGWIILVTIVPMLGQIVALILGLMCIFGEGQGHENKYGPVPTNIVEKPDLVTMEAE